jgi:hypothetical protein
VRSIWLGSAGQLEGLERQVEVADDRVVDELDAGGVYADVVGGPADPELVAAGGQLPDQIRDSSIVGVAAGLGAQQGDRVVGDLGPVTEELRCMRVEEDETGVVGRAGPGRRRSVSTERARGRWRPGCRGAR